MDWFTSPRFWVALGLIGWVLGFLGVMDSHFIYTQSLVAFGVSAVLYKVDENVRS